MARIFVTGGGGFIGRNVVPQLLTQGHSVVALQRDSNILPSLHRQLTVIHGDLRDNAASLRPALSDCDTVLHLAADTTPSRSATNLEMELRVNLSPFLNLLELLRDTPVNRIVILSSGGTVYGRPLILPIDESHPTMPITPYGLGKLTIEHLARLWASQNGIKYILLRAANPYGPHQLGRNNQGVIGVWLQSALHNQPLAVWGDGKSVRDYLYVGDLAEALSVACGHPTLEAGIYNVGSGDGKSLLQIAEMVARVTGIDPRLDFAPAKDYIIAVNVLSTKRYEAATNWRPKMDLMEGMRLTYDFLRHSSPTHRN